MGFRCQALAQALHPARLSRSRLPDEEDHLAMALTRLPPAMEQQTELLCATHERRQVLATTTPVSFQVRPRALEVFSPPTPAQPGA